MLALLIVYVTLFVVFSSAYIILESIRVGEWEMEKEFRIPDGIMTLLKLIPSLLIVIFSIVFMPKISVLFILLPIAFFFCLLGDFFMEVQKIIGAIVFGLSQLLFFAAYLVEIVITSNDLKAQKVGISIFGVAWFVIILLVNFFFARYLWSAESVERLQQLRYLRLFYEVVIAMHLLMALLLTYNLFLKTPGIIVIAIGVLLFFISDKIIMVREFHHKPKKSVILIMTTYYLALFSISLLTQFVS